MAMLASPYSRSPKADQLSTITYELSAFLSLLVNHFDLFVEHVPSKAIGCKYEEAVLRGAKANLNIHITAITLPGNECVRNSS